MKDPTLICKVTISKTFPKKYNLIFLPLLSKSTRNRHCFHCSWQQLTNPTGIISQNPSLVETKILSETISSELSHKRHANVQLYPTPCWPLQQNSNDKKIFGEQYPVWIKRAVLFNKRISFIFIVYIKKYIIKSLPKKGILVMSRGRKGSAGNATVQLQ